MDHVTNVLGAGQGVTTACLLFIFVCLIFPTLIKNKPQFYGAVGMIVLVILLSSLALIVGSDKFAGFVGALGGLLQVAAILLLVLSAGGLSPKDLASDVATTFDVIRRGGEKETIIVPLHGQQPKSRAEREELDRPPREDIGGAGGYPTRTGPARPVPPEDRSIPLE